MSLDGNIFLAQAQWMALGDSDLFGHEVQTRKCLSDRMLHLDASVHLEEIKFIAFAVYKEFNGAGATVVQRPSEAERGGVYGRAHR